MYNFKRSSIAGSFKCAFHIFCGTFNSAHARILQILGTMYNLLGLKNKIDVPLKIDRNKIDVPLKMDRNKIDVPQKIGRKKIGVPWKIGRNKIYAPQKIIDAIVAQFHRK